MSNKKIFADKKGAIGWLVFNNPEKRNAISLDMAKMATQILDEFSNDDSIRVVILRGEGGKSFVSGQDISEFEKLRSTPEGIANYEKIKKFGLLSSQWTVESGELTPTMKGKRKVVLKNNEQLIEEMYNC